MKTDDVKSSWLALGLFYLALIIIITVLDVVNNVLTPPYWGMQIFLITIGTGIFALIGTRFPDMSAGRGILLAFVIGILTIIPAVLMGLGRIPGLWQEYFSIALAMAAGSFLTGLFIRFSQKFVKKDESEVERD